jgi:hypothetical protein
MLHFSFNKWKKYYNFTSEFATNLDISSCLDFAVQKEMRK